MKSPNRKTSKGRTTVLFYSIIVIASIFCLPHPFVSAQLDVKRDKEKTTYVIGPDDRIAQEEAAEREKAWDMLRNTDIVVDKRKDPRTESPKTPAQPPRR